MDERTGGAAIHRMAMLRLAGSASTAALALMLAAEPGWAQQVLTGNDTEIVDGNDPGGTGSGTQPAPWTINTDLVIGDQNGDDATLIIRNGGAVSNDIGVLGVDPGASGTVTVTGSGSSWSNSDDLYIGHQGTGALTIEDGAVVDNQFGYIGYFSGASGTVTVTGTGSSWTNFQDLTIGDSGTGTLIISNGGTVNSASGYISNDSNAIGEVIVTGANSLWSNSIEVSVGAAGAGTLTISNGGSVTGSFGYVGFSSNGSGVVSVTSAGSSWISSGALVVGQFGSGSVSINDAGMVSASEVVIADDSGAIGTIELAGSAGSGRGILETGYVERGGGSASLVFDGGILRATGNEANFLRGFSVGEVTLDAGGAFVDTNGFAVGITTDLQGVGGLTKQGTGTLTLSGINAYTGVTTVEAGTLVAGSAGAFVQNGAYTVNGGILDLGGFDLTMGELSGSGGEIALGSADLTLDQASDSIYGGTLSGSGDFTMAGSGTLRLTGDNSGFTGTTTVSDGHLIVNGSLGGILTMTGGRLGGSGDIGALTAGAGVTIAPGNSIGTLNVGGNLTFDPGATYEVEVDPAGTASDLISVTGIAFLNGATVSHIGMNGHYKPFSTYTILTASGGVSGTFGAVTSNYAFLAADLSYDLNNVYLEIARNDVSFADMAATRNQIATAQAAESLGSGNDIYDAIVTLPDDESEIQASFDALSGEIHASIKTALITQSLFLREAANDRLRSAFGDPGAAMVPIQAFWPGAPQLTAGDTADGPVFWSTALGGLSETFTDGNAATFRHQTGGFLAGVDSNFDEVRFGLMAGYSNSRFDPRHRASSGSSDDYHLGLYAGTHWGGLAFRSGLAYTWHAIETSRRVAIGSFEDRLDANYGGGTLQGFAELGYRFERAAASFEPFVNLAHVGIRTAGFSEEGGAAALDVSGCTTNTTITTLGLRAETEIRLGETSAVLHGMSGWRHAAGDIVPLSTQAFAGGDAFTVAGVPLAENAFVLDAGLDVALNEGAALGIAYSGQIAEDAQQHGVKATLSVKF
ncbi:autotransporter outer membrane beta-barrel domain-containing protein [Rhizobium sophoriradicis]|uniref:autotransporter outer membrane beta-barrel domain-containing protein n=1 Tax=Rhizobium sophoriradicis TaxID=1535245 RepID=UPI000BBD67D4|nr:autotransporter domain-containing protein [Rhizobium sophoriradicis]PCK88697.1 autotransporter outer membrane beta-barrel domain-containing protein [Rhizobium sophoriradicis]